MMRISLEETGYKPHRRVTEIGLLDSDLVVGKPWMDESRKFIRRPQL